MHRRILALVSALLLLAALTACGQTETAETTVPQTAESRTTAAVDAEGDIASPDAKPQTQPSQAADAPAADTPADTQQTDAASGGLYEKFVYNKVKDGTYTLRTEQSGMKVIVSMDGSDSAIESDAAGILHFSLVHQGSDYYMVMHTSKKVAKLTEDEYKRQVDSVGSTVLSMQNMQFRSSGTETVNGKQYSTETYDEGQQGVVTYFFDDSGIRRSRVVKNGKTTETDVFTVSDDADMSVFAVPADYAVVSSPAELLG